MGWLPNILIAIDQLGNALAGGHPDVTISARVGYHTLPGQPKSRYWSLLRRVIDFTFWPIDGDGHCRQAYDSDVQGRSEMGSRTALAILGVFVIAGCLLMALPVRVFAVFGKA